MYNSLRNFTSDIINQVFQCSFFYLLIYTTFKRSIYTSVHALTKLVHTRKVVKHLKEVCR